MNWIPFGFAIGLESIWIELDSIWICDWNGFNLDLELDWIQFGFNLNWIEWNLNLNWTGLNLDRIGMD